MSNHSSARPHTIKSTNNQTISEAHNQYIAPTDLEKIETLVEIICGARNESPAALLVLMATLENSSEPQALAHAAKHFAFTRCGELNLYGIVDAQTALVESKLLAVDSFAA